MSTLPREPFDAEEARVARAYAALPAVEPSAALDARILAQARGAVAAKRRSRPWFLGAGLGTAAAAVMAAGLAWQLGWLDRTPSGSGPAPTRQAPPRASAEEVQRVEVEVIRRERAAEPAPAAAPVPPVPVTPPVRTQAPAPRRAAAPPPPPAPAPEPVLSDAPLAVPAAPQPFPAEAAQAETDGAAAADAAAAPPRDDFESKRAFKPDLDAVGVSGTRLGRAVALPPWTTDETLPPAAWLERIRERVRAGDRQDAEHSLRRFVQRHPRQSVPPELRRLLVE